jgi:hypothetical protein
MPKVSIYFGCERPGVKGHYYWLPGMKMADGGLDGARLSPFGEVDGRLTPPATTTQGAAALHHCGGWTALAIHDYSVDRRPGSNSVFLFYATLAFDEAVAAAREAFPDVVSRIGVITRRLVTTEPRSTTPGAPSPS